ncbi:hypothetical protein BYT27DRAFT_7187078 [Phlegmacium glaucopus]|nr:hypothetical protein BYT27DRAFT_7187078 [Phlegmacium glaucopus]
MILDDKVIMHPLLIPPPAYHIPSQQSSPSLHNPSKLSLSTLPPHILLQILHRTFPQSSRIPDQGTPELQRKTLYWMSTALRLVNRALYTACMHILRSTYLRAYQALLKLPYSSDPFPISSGPPAYEPDGSPVIPYAQNQTIPDESPLQTIQRETLILDRFITLKVREDVFSDESCLHLEGDDKFRDLFNLAQPQARLEDLVRIYGVKEGVVTISGVPTSPMFTTGSIRMYASSLSSSQTSFQPPTSPFHDSNAVTVTHPILTQLPPPIHQVTTVSNTITTTNKPPRSTGFFSAFKKLTYGSSPSSPSPRSPRSPSSPLSIPGPNTLIDPSIYYPNPPPIPKSKPIQPLPFSSLSITFTFQSIKLIQKRKEDGSRKCVAEVPRSRGGAPGIVGRRETLEALAEGLVRALKEGLQEESSVGK